MKQNVKWRTGFLTTAIAAAAATFLLFSTHVVGAPQLGDIEGHWGKAAIQTAVSRGYVDGYEDQSFKPDRNVTRAEFLKMVVTALKLPVAAAEGKGNPWYTSYVNTSLKEGLHQYAEYPSVDDWNQPISRFEMARMAARAVGEVNDEDLKWMYLATKAGLIQGMDDQGTLAEEGSTTRAQSVTIIERILDVKGGKTLPADQHAVGQAEILWHKTNIFTVMPVFFGGRVIEPWDPEKMTIETPDGLYKGVMEKLIAVDFGDPNDPYRNLLGDFEKVTWTVGGDMYYPVSWYPNSYGIVAIVKTEFNHDTSKYGKDSKPTFYISGFMGGKIVQMSKTGELTSFADLVDAEGKNETGWIVPKRGQKTGGTLQITLEAPAIPPYESYPNTILWVATPNIIE